MANVKIGKLSIRVRGAARTGVRNIATTLGPALQRALATTATAPIAARDNLEVAVPRGRGPLADRIATPLARGLRGGSK
jgi:hypothetical protein